MTLATQADTTGYSSWLDLQAPCERVFDAVATVEGLRRWWTSTVSGSAAEGGVLRFDFPGQDHYILMRVYETRRPSTVRWFCLIHTHSEAWNATTVAFDLIPHGANGCTLSFRHVHLAGETVAAGWGECLTSLGEYVERGRGAPLGRSANGDAAAVGCGERRSAADGAETRE